MVPADGEVNIFQLQEKVIASIVQSSIEQVAVEEAPRLLDPIQQTVATTLRAYIHHPTVSRIEIIAAIQRVTEPQPGVFIKALRKAYETFLTNNELDTLLAAVKSIGIDTVSNGDNGNSEVKSPVRREDLKLICFDYVWQ